MTGADAKLKINNIIRIGCHQSYTGSGNDQGGTAKVVIDGNKNTAVSYFYMGNQLTQSSLTVTDGAFTTTSTNENKVFGSSYITLSNSTLALKGALTLNDTSSLTLTNGSTITGTSLAFAGDNNIYVEGLGTSITLTKDLTFNGNTDMTLYLADPYAEEGDYKLFSANTTTGQLESLTLVSPIGTLTLPGDSSFLNYTGGLSLHYNPSIAPLPEPATWVLLIVGIFGSAVIQRVSAFTAFTSGNTARKRICR